MDSNRPEKSKITKKSKYSRKKLPAKSKNSKDVSQKTTGLRFNKDFSESNILKRKLQAKLSKRLRAYNILTPKLTFTKKESRRKGNNPPLAKEIRNQIDLPEQLSQSYKFMKPCTDSNAFFKKLRLDSTPNRLSSISPASQKATYNFCLSPESEFKFNPCMSIFDDCSQISTDLSRNLKLSRRINQTAAYLSTTDSLFGNNYT